MKPRAHPKFHIFFVVFKPGGSIVLCGAASVGGWSRVRASSALINQSGGAQVLSDPENAILLLALVTMLWTLVTKKALYTNKEQK